MDYYGRWKAQQYMTKHAYEEFLISAVKENDSIKIVAISDIYKTTEATLQLSLIDFNGKELKKVSKQLVLPENCSQLVYSFKQKDWVSTEIQQNTVLHLKLMVNNKIVSENNFYFGKPKDLNLPKPHILLKQTGDNTIEVSTDKMAKNVWLFLPETINAFSDNYFDLLPGKNKTIEVKSANLKAEIRKIQVKTLVDTY